MVLGGALCWKIMNLTLTVYLCDWGLKLSVSQNFKWWEVGGGMNSQKSFRKNNILVGKQWTSWLDGTILIWLGAAKVIAISVAQWQCEKLGCIAEPETVGASKYHQIISNLSKLVFRVVRYFRHLIVSTGGLNGWFGLGPKFGTLNLYRWFGFEFVLFSYLPNRVFGLQNMLRRTQLSFSSIFCLFVGPRSPLPKFQI